MRFLLLLFSLLITMSCSNKPHFSQSTFVESRFNLSSYTFSIYHPPYLVSEFPPTETVYFFDVTSVHSDDYNTLMTKYYEYNGGAFDGVYGDLKLSVRVNKWNVDNDKGSKVLFSIYSMHLEKADAIKIKTIELNSFTWYRYQFSNSNSLFLATPLNENYYLQVIFHYINNDRGHNSGWYNDALTTSDRIMRSMVLRMEI